MIARKLRLNFELMRHVGSTFGYATHYKLLFSKITSHVFLILKP